MEQDFKEQHNQPVLAIIGGGNMGRSLIGGLLKQGWPAASIHVADPDRNKREWFSTHLEVQTFAENAEALAGAEAVVLAVKPQAVGLVARELGEELRKLPTPPLVISVAAGIVIGDLIRFLGFPAPIVRVMPNTPALVSAGASGMFASESVTDAQQDLAESLMRALGTVVWLERESMMDVVTAVSGSGPAYVFLMLEAMEEAAVAEGLDRATARLLAVQTVFGAAKMALESKDAPQVLRAQVTSPGGTTAAGVRVLEDGLRTLFYDAIDAAARRSEELARRYGEEV